MADTGNQEPTFFFVSSVARNEGEKEFLSRHFHRHRRAERGAAHPKQPSADHQAQSDCLRSRHEAEELSASGVAAEELDEIAPDTVDDHVRANDLAFKLLAANKPDE